MSFKLTDDPSVVIYEGYNTGHRLTMSLETLDLAEKLKLPSKFTKRCHSQANKGLIKMERLSICLSNRS